MVVQFFEIGASRKNEHSTIPAKTSFSEICFRCIHIRFFNKLFNRVCQSCHPLACANVPVTRFWFIGDNTKSHKIASNREIHSRLHVCLKQRLVCHTVIRRQHNENGIRFDTQRRNSNCGRCISTDRLKNNLSRRAPRFSHLLSD